MIRATTTRPMCEPHRALLRARGFTLMELSIVLVIVAVIAAIAAPRLGASSGRYRVQAAAKRIALDIEAARRAAVHASGIVQMDFNVDKDWYVWRAKVDGVDAHGGQDLSISPFECAIIMADCGGDGQLEFNGRGTPDTDATIAVASGRTACTVVVSASGSITIGTPVQRALAVSRKPKDAGDAFLAAEAD